MFKNMIKKWKIEVEDMKKEVKTRTHIAINNLKYDFRSLVGVVQSWKNQVFETKRNTVSQLEQNSLAIDVASYLASRTAQESAKEAIKAVAQTAATMTYEKMAVNQNVSIPKQIIEQKASHRVQNGMKQASFIKSKHEFFKRFVKIDEKNPNLIHLNMEYLEELKNTVFDERLGRGKIIRTDEKEEFDKVVWEDGKMTLMVKEPQLKPLRAVTQIHRSGETVTTAEDIRIDEYRRNESRKEKEYKETVNKARENNVAHTFAVEILDKVALENPNITTEKLEYLQIKIQELEKRFFEKKPDFEKSVKQAFATQITKKHASAHGKMSDFTVEIFHLLNDEKALATNNRREQFKLLANIQETELRRSLYAKGKTENEYASAANYFKSRLETSRNREQILEKASGWARDNLTSADLKAFAQEITKVAKPVSKNNNSLKL